MREIHRREHHTLAVTGYFGKTGGKSPFALFVERSVENRDAADVQRHLFFLKVEKHRVRPAHAPPRFRLRHSTSPGVRLRSYFSSGTWSHRRTEQILDATFVIDDTACPAPLDENTRDGAGTAPSSTDHWHAVSC